MQQFFRHAKNSPVIILSVLVILGLFLQIHAVSPYKIYPDSYQSLLVADNLLHAHRLTAALGPHGMIYPEVFGWTRPLYPALIAMLTATGFTLTAAAQTIAVAAGLLAIPAVFAATNVVLRSRRAGLIAAGLLAISYSHAIWGGFILTEPLEILVVTLAIWQLWRRRPASTTTGIKPDSQDILTGLVFALAILTRYENALLLIPALIWCAPRPNPKRAATIGLTAIVITAAVLLLLQPISGGLNTLWPQLASYAPVITGGVSIALLAIAAAYSGLLATTSRRRIAGRVASILLILAALALDLYHQLYLGVWEFAARDPLISILALFGLVLMLTTRALQSTAAFIILACGLLLAAYYQTNPTMDRYASHLVPLLLIPAGYAVIRILRFPRRPRSLVLVTLAAEAVLQLALTSNGLHYQDAGVWFQPGYEEQNAQRVAAVTKPGDLIIAATPEPYYLATGTSIQGVATSQPYLSLRNLPANQSVIIIQDQALRDRAPQFSAKITNKLSAFRVTTFNNPTPFRTVTSIELGLKPVMVYKLPLSQLELLNQ